MAADARPRPAAGSGWACRARPADADDRLDVERALAALPRRQREATVLRYYLGLDVAEVAGDPRRHRGHRQDLIVPRETGAGRHARRPRRGGDDRARFDDRLTKELERAARPAEPTGVFEEIDRRRGRRVAVRRVQTALLATAVFAGSIGGVLVLNRAFRGEGATTTPALPPARTA